MNRMLHVHPDSENVNDFILHNLSCVSGIKMTTNTLLEELDRLDIIESSQSINALVVCRKITNEVFNNNATKDRAPISTPEFCTELANYLANRGVTESFLIACYHYSIPIFLTDTSVANDVFGAQFISEVPLMSSDKDFSMYQKILNSSVIHYVYAGEYGETVCKPGITFLSSIGPNYPDITIIYHNDFMEENDGELPYLYDKIL